MNTHSFQQIYIIKGYIFIIWILKYVVIMIMNIYCYLAAIYIFIMSIFILLFGNRYIVIIDMDTFILRLWIHVVIEHMGIVFILAMVIWQYPLKTYPSGDQLPNLLNTQRAGCH